MTTIAEERAALSSIGRAGALRTREQAGFRFDYTTARDVDEPATRVFVHITITNPAAYSSEDVHARAVEAIGIDRFPNTGISYNRLIMRSGRAYEGQPMGRRGAHTINDFARPTCTTPGCPGRGGPLTAPSWNLNVNSMAYAICQNIDDSVTDAQLDSLARAIAADMLAGLVHRGADIHGHRCVSTKSCPGDLMWARMTELRRLVDHYLANGFTEDVIEMATLSELKTAIAEGTEIGFGNYVRRFFMDGQGTGDTIWDESRINASALLAAVNDATDEKVLIAVQELGAKLDTQTAAINALAVALTPKG